MIITDGRGGDVGGLLHESSGDSTVLIGQGNDHVVGNVGHNTGAGDARVFVVDIVAVVGLGRGIGHLGGKGVSEVLEGEEASNIGRVELETVGVGGKGHNDVTIAGVSRRAVGDELDGGGKGLADLGSCRREEEMISENRRSLGSFIFSNSLEVLFH